MLKLENGKLIEENTITSKVEIDVSQYDKDTANIEAEIVRLQTVVAGRKAKRDEMTAIAPDIAKLIEA
jgi:hypothetical protein